MTVATNSIWRFLKRLKLELEYGPAIPLLGKYPKECKLEIIETLHTHVYKNTIHNS
jgi:hypothetical protein